MSQEQNTKDFLESLFKQGPALKIIASALTSTIKSYTKTPVVAGKPYIQGEAHSESVAVAGLIRFEAVDFSIELFLGFSKELFLKLYENMFQSVEAEITNENQDLAGEILNIAFGQMDPEFRKLGYSFRCSFPIVHSGKKLKDALASVQAKAIVVPYTCNSQSFFVEIYAMDSLREKWHFEPHKRKSA